MTKLKKIIVIFLIIFLATLGYLIGKFYYQNLRGIGPAISKPPKAIPDPIIVTTTQSGNDTTTPKTITHDPRFTVPNNFYLNVFAKNLPGARVMIFDKDGNLWLSQTSQGKISKLTIKDGKVIEQKTIFSGLVRPHGLAFDPDDQNILYIAEETKISKVTISGDKFSALKKIIDLPKGANHFTRTLLFGPDKKIYVSIGSTCNVCNEKDERYAAIWSMNKDGSDWQQIARGLRNSVFMVLNEKDGNIWATDNGRDLIGDNIPPDEINIIPTSKKDILNYGWPICYGKNIHDTAFDKNTYIRNPCMEPFETPSHIDLPAHSAALGLAFVPKNAGWPNEYAGDLIVAFHGSWNRSTPTGYKLVRIELDDNQNFVKQEDFVTGFLPGKSAWGRPVDIIFDKTGKMFISDDRAGTIYSLEYIP